MDLETLHKKLSQDDKYLRSYTALGGMVELAIQCRATRQDQALSVVRLASKLKIPTRALMKFEDLKFGDLVQARLLAKKIRTYLRETSPASAKVRATFLQAAISELREEGDTATDRVIASTIAAMQRRRRTRTTSRLNRSQTIDGLVEGGIKQRVRAVAKRKESVPKRPKA